MLMLMLTSSRDLAFNCYLRREKAKQEIKEERERGRVGALEGGRERNTKAAISAAVAAGRGKQWARDIGEREMSCS